MSAQSYPYDEDAMREVLATVGNNQSELARRLGCSRSLISMCLKHKRLTVDRCLRLEEITGVPRERLLPTVFKRSAA